MPSVSKKQQRLFGWALACKSGKSKNCPPSVKKLADTMDADELEKFAKTSHKGLPEKVRESLDRAIDATVELVEAELGIDLETYEYEVNEDKIEEGKTIEIEQPDGKKLATAKKEEKTGKLSDAKEEKDKSKEVPEAKSEVEGGKNEILMPKGKKLADAKTVPAASKESKVDKAAPPSVDNKKDEADTSWNKPNPGMEKAEKNVMGKVYTPSVHKFPMGKATNERRVYDFNGFLKIINYKTHDGIEQKGHGQNLTGDAGMA